LGGSFVSTISFSFLQLRNDDIQEEEERKRERGKEEKSPLKYEKPPALKHTGPSNEQDCPESTLP
jgi:hypothetical protein